METNKGGYDRLETNKGGVVAVVCLVYGDHRRRVDTTFVIGNRLETNKGGVVAVVCLGYRRCGAL